MSNGIVIVRLLGRFGNNALQYAFSRAYAESIGAEFRCDRWVGQRIFQIEDKPIGDAANLTRRSELDLVPGETNIDFMGYAQNEKAMIYTLAQMRGWFKLRPEIEESLKRLFPIADDCVAHRRVGDYFGYGYPVVSMSSYEQFAMLYGIPKLTWITEENPTYSAEFPGEMAMLPDFWRLMRAKILLRGNSTFSWLAACLNTEGRIFSPIIDGLEGGREHHCRFVEGNWPRFANLGFTTDMRVKGSADDLTKEQRNEIKQEEYDAKHGARES